MNQSQESVEKKTESKRSEVNVHVVDDANAASGWPKKNTRQEPNLSTVRHKSIKMLAAKWFVNQVNIRIQKKRNKEKLKV